VLIDFTSEDLEVLFIVTGAAEKSEKISTVLIITIAEIEINTTSIVRTTPRAIKTTALLCAPRIGSTEFFMSYLNSYVVPCNCVNNVGGKSVAVARPSNFGETRG